MSNNNKTLVFWGTSDFAVPALKSLLNFGYKVTAVVTQPEKPVGRARITMPSPVKKIALENHIPVFEPHFLKKDEEFFKHFKHLKPEICIVAAYGKIIPAQYLDISKYGFLNIHPSLLPKYRGPSPIQTAIMNGDPILQRPDASGKINRSLSDGAGTETGVSIMLMDEQVDHGPILSSKPYYIPPTTYYTQAEEDLAKLGAELLIETLPKYLNGEIKPKKQDHAQATFTKLLSREDGRIDWNRTAKEIYNQIRALNPEPGTWTLLCQGFGGRSKVLNIRSADFKCLEAQPLNKEIEPRGLVKILTGKIAVVTKKCYLILKQIQLEGRKEMDTKSFLNGHPDLLDSRLE